MSKMIDILRNLFLDLFSMGKGFMHGFVVVGLFIGICGVFIYGFLYLKNIIF